jgi:hypothetical protein
MQMQFRIYGQKRVEDNQLISIKIFFRDWKTFANYFFEEYFNTYQLVIFNSFLTGLLGK